LFPIPSLPLSLFALFLCACRKPTPLPNPAPPPQPAPPPISSGRIISGRYYDSQYDFSIALPDGWSGEVGIWDDPLRVRFYAPADPPRSGAWLGIYSTTDALELPLHATCTWHFQNTGHYAGFTNTLIADCLPDNGSSLILASCRRWKERGICVEANLNPGTLKDLYEVANPVLRSLQ
jgi:hypothetical protein